ncbi:STAS domain-containing protein [Alteribacillus sp. JSM 102045]|uniref:STAS domain-containing protein n=1 Tax=Alteribacillus sp. JSM 102045 TaxID=1562101 RepID=UPI0035C11526
MKAKSEINVEGLDFGWELEKGQFQFEGEDAVLFWISDAMKTFFDTIEEVSGKDAANVVLETTGYRQGLIVGDYFENLKNVSVDVAAKLITTTYASAGWGKAYIEDLNWEEKTFTVQLKDDWEYKINLAQEKQIGGNFLPAHYAGIFTRLFKTNIWYEVKQYQIEGHDYTLIDYFPSEVNVTQNIHQFARTKEMAEIQRLQEKVEEKTNELKELVKTISSPMIPVLEEIVVVPLLGKYDEERGEELIDKTLYNLPKHKAKYLILDLTGLDKKINQHTIHSIDKLASAASMIGAKTILVGISVELGLMSPKLNIDFSKFECFQTLEHGVYYALAQRGRKII